jgi:hypothetical protein
LTLLKHVPYSAVEPTGFRITSDEWVSAGAMLERMNFAIVLASGRVAGVSVDPLGALDPGAAAALPGPETRAGDAGGGGRIATAVLQHVFHGLASAELHALVRDALAEAPEGDPSATLARALALALGSPEFQRY